MDQKLSRYEAGLHPYLPEGTARQVSELLAPYALRLVISEPRKTKKADYRPPQRRGRRFHQITINRDLNPYAFLITLLHELAHLQTHEHYDIKHVQPHGPEWKAFFKDLVRPFWKQDCFPGPVKDALAAYMQNPAAATCASPALTKALRAYDKHQFEVFISDLPFGGYFYWRQSRLFQRLKKQRTRYQALEVNTGHYYLFNQHALVKPYEGD